MAPLSKITWPTLGKLSQKEFLARYWQKKPVLLKGALRPFPDLITPEELAGMSCDKEVESRLIIQGPGKNKWKLQRGPFSPSTFKKLPKKKWTILVNGVDRFVPSVHAFLDNFSFIPFWRMDDVMISYAVDGGNVGAHVDNFDVFLVQASGRREWMIEDRPVLEDDFIPNLPVRLLRRFKPTHRWVLEPGDILYLPPRVPHHGIARGDRCMTISVGFRAPSLQEIINGVVSTALSQVDENHRYSDPELSPQKPGEISLGAIRKIQESLAKAVLSDHVTQDWLGTYITEPYSDVNVNSNAEKIAPAKVGSALKDAIALVRAEGARMAYVKGKKSAVTFYLNGAREELSGKPGALAQLLSDRIVTPIESVRPFLKDKACQALLSSLFSTGALIIEQR